MNLFPDPASSLWIRLVLPVLLITQSALAQVLVVQDEMPQIEVLSDFLQNTGKLKVDVVDQAHLPDDMSSYQAVIGFIHGELKVAAEKAIIAYTEAGGRYVCLHHSISSGKAKNEFYFDFLGIQLDHPESSSKPVKPGEGYGWFHDDENGITYTLVNLNPHHYITNHHIEWSTPVAYTSSDEPAVEREYPAIALQKTEVYMNHKFTDGREKTVLCGVKYSDPRNGELFMQDRGVWWKHYGEGLIFYLMPGHASSDYENPNIAQMVLNAINWQP
uniref:ThuA domain-containing protein n=1 Tax=Roseihalotalea indica TaxID=2867963 RepID=A0AA49GS14_9BACT|nr:ThuA domain-containing protein [Tunicatimonas sp. TK19036]